MTNSSPDLSVLIVEDNPNDAELLLRHLRLAGFTPRARRVQTEPDYLSALAAGAAPGQAWDVILSDYELPDFSGPRALQLLLERGADTPFIVISGFIGDELAVQTIKQGASDYLTKDRLGRVGPAVTAALEAQRLRRSLRQTEANYLRLFENSIVGIYQTRPDGRLLAANAALAAMLGYDSPADLLAGRRDPDRQTYVDPGRRAEYKCQMDEHGAVVGFESQHYRKDGSTIWVSENARAVRDAAGQVLYYEGVLEDITARRVSAEAMRESEARYRGLFADSPIALWEEDFSAVKQRLDALRQTGVADIGAYLDDHPQFVIECAALYRIIDVNRTTLRLYGAQDKQQLIDNLGQIFGLATNPALRDELASIAAGKAEHHLEAVNRTLAGEPLHISLSWAALPGHEHDLARVIVSTVDVTDRKRAQEAVAHNERRFRALIENSADGIALLDAQGVVLYTSPAAARIVGGPPEMWLGGNFLNRVHPDDLARMAGLLAGLVQTPGARQTAEFRYRRQDESWCWLEVTAANMLAEPAVAAIVANYRDVTERRQAQDALQASEARFSAMFRASPVAIALATLVEGRYDDVNAAFERFTGYARAEIIGKTVADINLWADPAEQAGVIAALNERGSLSDIELSLRHRSGQVMQSLTSLELLQIGGENYVLGLFMDITDRKRAAAALAQQRNLLRTLIDNIPDAIYVKDVHSRFVIKNLTDALRMGAASPDETVGKTDFDYYPAELAAQYQADDQAVIDSGQAILNREEPITEASGRTGWVSTTKVPLRDPHGRIIGLVGIGHDVTDSRQAAASLRQSQADLENAQALAHLGSWTRDAATDLTAWSQELFRLHYLAPGPAAPSVEAYFETVHPDDRPLLARTMNAVERGVDDDACVYRTNPALGPERVLELNFHTVRAEGGRVIRWHGTVLDVTERKKRLAELEAVNRVSTALRTAQNLSELLPRLLDESLAILNASAGSIWLYDPLADEVRLAYERGWRPDVPPFKRGQGVPGHVVATGQPYVSRELKDPRMPESLRAFVPAGRGGACVAIRAGDEITGALYLNVELPRELSPADVRLMTTLAEIGGIAIHRTRLNEQTELRLGQLTALREVDRAIMGSLDLRLTLNILLEQVTTRLGVDAASVLLFDDKSAMLNFAAGRGFRTRAIPQTRLQIGQSYAGRVARERQILRASDLHEPGNEFQTNRLLAGEEFVSYVGAPLVTKGQLRGVLEVFHRARLVADAGWLSFFEDLAGQAAIAIDNGTLFANLARSNLDLQMAYDATIEGWARALDLRDKETEGHSRRVTELTEQLALQMGMSDEALVHVRRGALLHDIGKMGVPDGILLKPGPLTDAEWAIMRQHPQFAYDMISPISYLLQALDIPYGHHEKWDGTGYPRGLRGEQIPRAARIFAVVDVWDALRSDRPYRAAWPPQKVRDYLSEQSGRHFDPAVVEAFLQTHTDDR